MWRLYGCVGYVLCFLFLVTRFHPDSCVQDEPTHVLDVCKIEEPDSYPQRKDANSAPPLSDLHVAAQHISIPTTRATPSDEDSSLEFPSITGPKPMLAAQTRETLIGSGRFAHWMVLYEKRHQRTPMICRATAKVLTYLACLSALTIFLCPAEVSMEAQYGLGAPYYRCYVSLLYDDSNLAYT